MVTLRLRREGKKKYPVYKLVAADARSPRDGRYLEALGQYNPNVNPAVIGFKENRVEHWLQKGAQPTYTVRSLLQRTGFWLQWTLKRQGKNEDVIKKVVERWQMQQADKAKHEADRKARRAERKKKAAPAAEATPAAETAPATDATPAP